MSLTRLRTGELIAAIGAVALFIAMFLPWYDLKGGNRTKFILATSHHALPPTGSAWDAYATIFILLLALIVAALALPVVTAAEQKIEFPLAASVAAYGVLMVLLIGYKLFAHRPGGNTFTEVAYGGYLGLAAIIAITVGAGLTAREDRALFPGKGRGSPAAEGEGAS
jgi:hypothetical protein